MSTSIISYSSWYHQKAIGLLIISVGRRSLNSHHIISKIWIRLLIYAMPQIYILIPPLMTLSLPILEVWDQLHLLYCFLHRQVLNQGLNQLALHSNYVLHNRLIERGQDHIRSVPQHSQYHKQVTHQPKTKFSQ